MYINSTSVFVVVNGETLSRLKHPSMPQVFYVDMYSRSSPEWIIT